MMHALSLATNLKSQRAAAAASHFAGLPYRSGEKGW